MAQSPTTSQRSGYATLQTVTASQAHHESAMSGCTEPLSAYARWKIEEDEHFYATFPDARCAAHQYEHISSVYLEGTRFYYDANGRLAVSELNTCVPPLSVCTDTTHCDKVGSYSLPYGVNYSSHDYHIQPEPAPQHTLAHTTLPSHFTQDCVMRSFTYDLPDSSGCSNTLVKSDPASPTSTYLPPLQTEAALPSQHLQPKPEPLMDSLPPPDSLVSPTSSSSSYTSTPHNIDDNLSYYQSHHYDASPRSDFSQACMPYNHHLSHSHTYQHPYTFSYSHSPNDVQPPVNWPTVRTPSPQGIRLSPLPLPRRPPTKKPSLACLFCRGRKIACGPPDPESSDRSCNQCQRRSIKCEYPTESRRGMRKKKSQPNVRPKVRLGKRSKVLQ